PDDLASFLVKGNHGGLAATRRADELVAIDQRRLGEVPAPRTALEVLAKVLSPDFRAVGGDADQVAELADGDDQITVHGGRAARPLVVAPLATDLHRPELLAGLLVEGVDMARIANVAHGEDLAAGHRDRGEADAGARGGCRPDHFRPGL